MGWETIRWEGRGWWVGEAGGVRGSLFGEGRRIGADGVRGAWGMGRLAGGVSEGVVERRSSGDRFLISSCRTGLIGGERRRGPGPRFLREDTDKRSMFDRCMRTRDLPRSGTSSRNTLATSNRRAALSLPPVAKYLPSGDQVKPQICCE